MPPRGRHTTLARKDESYTALSDRPLHVLVFLLPLIALYEVGLAFFLSSPDGTFRETILAHNTLSRFFQTFGPGSLYLPGIALIVVLVVWHLIRRDRWSIRTSVLFGMAAESVLWMFPLLVFGLIMSMEAALATTGGSGDSWQAKATLSIGAGLYEELLFRLLMLTALHAILHDVLGMKDQPAAALAVVGSAVAFCMYHGVSPLDTAQLPRTIFYTVAGLYFGVVFLLRGFGIVVATHAFYDLMVLVVVPVLKGRAAG